MLTCGSWRRSGATFWTATMSADRQIGVRGLRQRTIVCLRSRASLIGTLERAERPGRSCRGAVRPNYAAPIVEDQDREPQACNYRPVITSMAVEVSQRSLERNLSGGKLLGTRRPFGRPKRVTGRSPRAFSLRSAGAQPGGLREGGRGRRAAADPSQRAGTIRGAVSQNPIRGEEPCRTDGGNIGLTWPKSQLP